MTEKFYVQTRTRSGKRSFLWNGHEPLLIGYPIEALLERGENGAIRVRDLSRKKSEEKKVAELIKQPTLYDAKEILVKVRPLVPGAILDASALKSITDYPIPEDDEQTKKVIFKLSMGLAGLCVAIAISTFFVTPKEKEPEKEPVVVKFAGGQKADQGQQVETAQSAAPNAANSQQARSQARAQARVKALKSSIQGILKGGIGTFMKNSQSLNVVQNLSAGGSALAKSLGTVTGDGQAGTTGPNTGIIGGTGKQGYAKTGAGGISGQGQIQIDLDLSNSSVAEGLTKDEVGRVIHSHMAEIRYCYESSMIRNPDLEGKLEVDFTINSGGTVKSADVKSSTLNDPSLEDCVIRKLVRWRFPKPKGGVEVAVSYPFIFKSLGR